MFELIRAALRLASPLALTALGGVVSERSGIIALHLEGVMLTGAFAAAAAAKVTGNAIIGLFFGAIAGGMIGLLHAFLTQRLKTPHMLSGVGINLAALGMTTFALRQSSDLYESAPQIAPVVIVLLAALGAILVSLALSRTTVGLRLKSCGENPGAARSAGIPVARLRYEASFFSGILAGTGGAALSLVGLGAFTENMTAGRGYIALAAVIFGKWSPIGAVGAACLFGLGDALQVTMQTLGWATILPPDLLTLLPYAITLIALTLFRGGVAPHALGIIDGDDS
jgi:simple sugar transport system permease protein